MWRGRLFLFTGLYHLSSLVSGESTVNPSPYCTSSQGNPSFAATLTGLLIQLAGKRGFRPEGLHSQMRSMAGSRAFQSPWRERQCGGVTVAHKQEIHRPIVIVTEHDCSNDTVIENLVRRPYKHIVHISTGFFGQGHVCFNVRERVITLRDTVDSVWESCRLPDCSYLSEGGDWLLKPEDTVATFFMRAP